ncbi:MAG: ferrochelatase [Deltaproteobacteria bacterium]|nr:MAG: ferrochelatase [Deltaproteobacteria bacterium]
MSDAAPTGLLLVNLGTPDDPSEAAVRRYLREFLSDPRVVDLSPVARWLLLHFVILPLRPAKSAEAYRKIWTEAGSPLLVHGRALADGVQARLGSRWQVRLAMRYGSPSIPEALDAFEAEGIHRIVLFPLFPQYASSTTGSAVQRTFEAAADREIVPAISVVPPFFADAGYLESQAALAREAMARKAPEHVLFTFHGLPIRQVKKADLTGAHCLEQPGCCEVEQPANRMCYRRHCFETARALAERLELDAGRWSLAFQSRLGRAAWLEPYTVDALTELARSGIRSVLVVAPSFVADCLETLEEIGLRGAEVFRQAGGEHFQLVPAVNASEGFVETVARLAEAMAP